MTYTVEAVRWSHKFHANLPYRLTYERNWLEDRQLWRDFLVRAEEVAPPENAIKTVAFQGEPAGSESTLLLIER